MIPYLKLKPTTRQLIDGWGILAVAAAAVAVAPAIQVSTAYTPTMLLLPGARRALQAAMAAHIIFALTILLPSLVAALGVYAGARVAGGHVYSPRLGRYGLGLSITGSTILFVSVLAYGWCASCLTYRAVLDSPVLSLSYALFALGLGATVVNFLLTVAWRIHRSHEHTTPVAIWRGD